MGAAWCRERAAHAHDSKSPLDRVIVSCVDKVYPQPKSPTAAVIPLDGDHRQRTYNITSVPLPAVHTPRRQNGGGVASGWQSAELEVPGPGQRPRADTTTSEDCESIGPTPVPPPRKKRRARSSAATAGAAARVAAAQAAGAAAGVGPPKAQRSVSTVVPPTIRTDDGDCRTQKLSTVSLPDYQQLHKAQFSQDKNHLSPGGGGGVGTSLSSISEATVERLDAYLRRCRSFGSVNTEELVERLAAQSRSHSPSHAPDSSSGEESDDSWSLGGLEQPVRPGEGPPLAPTHRLSGRRRRLGVALPRGSLPSEDQQEPWFHGQPQPRDAADSPTAFFPDTDRRPDESDTESGLREVRKELQSIVYDFNLYGNKEHTSRADLEVLPTRPITQERKKKISIKSITPPPSPELTDHEEDPVRNGEVDTRAEVVSKILNGYEKVIASATALRSPEAEAEAVLRQLGVPASLAAASPGGSSRRSSMTPSLSELEAAISDLLEQAQAADADDDDNGSADNRINNMLEDSDKNKLPDGSVSQKTVPVQAALPGKTAGSDSEHLDADTSASGNKGSRPVDATSDNEARGPTKKGSPDNEANGVANLSQHNNSNKSSGIPIDVSASNEDPSVSILTDIR